MPTPRASADGDRGLVRFPEPRRLLGERVEPVVAFGLLIATVMTLLVVPTLYSLFEDLSAKRIQALNRVGRLVSRLLGTRGGYADESR